MCEATAYILKNGKEEVLLPDVDIIEPEGEGLRLVSIFGEQKIVRAEFHQLRLSEHKIILAPRP
jgi:predicted RNA-binding protein